MQPPLLSATPCLSPRDPSVPHTPWAAVLSLQPPHATPPSQCHPLHPPTPRPQCAPHALGRCPLPAAPPCNPPFLVPLPASPPETPVCPTRPGPLSSPCSPPMQPPLLSATPYTPPETPVCPTHPGPLSSPCSPPMQPPLLSATLCIPPRDPSCAPHTLGLCPLPPHATPPILAPPPATHPALTPPALSRGVVPQLPGVSLGHLRCRTELCARPSESRALAALPGHGLSRPMRLPSSAGEAQCLGAPGKEEGRALGEKQSEHRLSLPTRKSGPTQISPPSYAAAPPGPQCIPCTPPSAAPSFLPTAPPSAPEPPPVTSLTSSVHCPKGLLP
ncbi:unnamed protein product [Caretta caretta]